MKFRQQLLVHTQTHSSTQRIQIKQKLLPVPLTSPSMMAYTALPQLNHEALASAPGQGHNVMEFVRKETNGVALLHGVHLVCAVRLEGSEGPSGKLRCL